MFFGGAIVYSLKMGPFQEDFAKFTHNSCISVWVVGINGNLQMGWQKMWAWLAHLEPLEPPKSLNAHIWNVRLHQSIDAII